VTVRGIIGVGGGVIVTIAAGVGLLAAVWTPPTYGIARFGGPRFDAGA